MYTTLILGVTVSSPFQKEEPGRTGKCELTQKHTHTHTYVLIYFYLQLYAENHEFTAHLFKPTPWGAF